MHRRAIVAGKARLPDCAPMQVNFRAPSTRRPGGRSRASVHSRSDVSDLTPPGQDLDALAASLRADAGDLNVFFQVLGGKLADSMPGAVELEREGGLFKKQHPVKKITIRAGGDVFEAELKHGSVDCRHAHAVRGIILRSDVVALDVWLRSLVGVLAQQARSSAAASQALRSLVI